MRRPLLRCGGQPQFSGARKNSVFQFHAGIRIHLRVLPTIGVAHLPEHRHLERIRAQPHMRLRYQCSPYHTNSALYPVIGQLERAARIQPDDSPEDKLDKLEALLALSGRPTAEAVPLIAPLLSIPFGALYAPANVSPLRQKQLKKH